MSAAAVAVVSIVVVAAGRPGPFVAAPPATGGPGATTSPATAARTAGPTAAAPTGAAPTSAARPGADRSTGTGLPGPSDPSSGHAGGLPGEADGAVPSRATVFDPYPAVTRLDPVLLAALRHAAADASRAGIPLHVTSGWRSAAHQERLLDEATVRYGSAVEAARWVAPPDRSRHVSGDAVDVGGAAAREWLARHGAAYGLCRTYRNEPWHFEWRSGADRRGCPAAYADAAHDPRLRR